MHIALIPPQDPTQQRPWFPAGHDGFDYATAHSEGWTISEAETGVQLQRVDSPKTCQPMVADDQDAWAHVVCRARIGLPLHRMALGLIESLHGS